MTARILVIGASPLRERFFVSAARLGLHTTVIEESVYARSDRLCDRAFAWRLVHQGRPGPDRERLDELAGRFDGVVPHTDWGVPIAAELCQRWGLPGAGPAAARRGHDKVGVRETANRLHAGGAVGYRVVREAADLPPFFADHPGPAILKPVDGTGSAGVRFVATGREAAGALPAALDCSATRSAIIEEFIQGREYSIEAVVRGGIAVVAAITEKTTSGPPSFIELRHIVDAGQQGSQAAAGAGCFAAELARALEVQDAVLHIEAKHSGGRWFLVEVSCRPAGGLIPDLVWLALGLDLHEEQLRCALGWPSQAPAAGPAERVAGIEFVAGTGTVADISSVYPIVAGLPSIRSVESLLAAGTRIDHIGANWWRAGYVLGASTSRADLEDDLAAAASRMSSALGLRPLAPVTVRETGT